MATTGNPLAPVEVLDRRPTEVGSYRPPSGLAVLKGAASIGQVTPEQWDMMKGIAVAVMGSSLIPEALRANRADVFVALLMSHALDVHFAVALTKGYVIKGRFDLEVDVKLGLALSRLPDFDYQVVEQTIERCTVTGGLRGKSQQTVTYTMDDAKRAGLLEMNQSGRPQHPGYHNNPKDQLMWRALGRLLKRVAPHALYNLPLVIDAEPGEGDSRLDIADLPNGAPVVVNQEVDPIEATTTTFHPPTAPPPDDEAKALALMKRIGWNNKTKLLNAVNHILKAIGLPEVRSSVSITKAEWTQIWTFLDRKYDGDGKPRVNATAANEVIDEASDEPVPVVEAEVVEDLVSPRPVDAQERPVAVPPAAVPVTADEVMGLAAEMGKRFNAHTFAVVTPTGKRYFMDQTILKGAGFAGQFGEDVDALDAGSLKKLKDGLLMLERGDRQKQGGGTW